LIVFDGLDEGELRKIFFVEVKSGKSVLSKGGADQRCYRAEES
jgi:predicted Holliday junction resolvase-like endonuclease